MGEVMTRFGFLFLAWLALAGGPALAALSVVGKLADGPVAVEFSEGEMAVLSPLLKLSIEPTPSQAARAFASLPLPTREKIVALRNAEIQGAFSADLVTYAKAHGLTFSELAEIRRALLESLATETISYLEANPQAIVRFIARDMNEVFHHFVAMVQSPALQRSPEQRLDLLRRAKAVTLSRPVAAKTPDADALWATLSVSQEELAGASEVLLQDLGYEGTLAVRTRRLVNQHPHGTKLRWRFAWKSTVAPAEVDQFPLTTFNHFIAEKFPRLAEGGALHRIPDGFRVRVLEHGAKWNRRSDGYVEEPVYVMLDVDDTVLKEVDYVTYGKNPHVQTVQYQPSEGAFQRYQERLRGGKTDGKRLHYEITGPGEIRSYVVVRPAMSSLLRDLKPLMDRGEVRLLVTSANDEKRTRAVCDQIKVGGHTLNEWGGTMISPSQFGILGGRKSVAKLRDDLQLGLVSPVVAIDDLGEKVVDYLPQDNSVSIEAWDDVRSAQFMNQAPEADTFAIEDEAAFAAVAQLIHNKRFKRAPSNWEERIRVLAGLMVPSADGSAVALPAPAPLNKVTTPSLWDITPQKHNDLNPLWGNWKRASLEAAAFSRVFHRGEDIYATGRDALIPLYALMLVSRYDPEFLNRVHYLDLSTVSRESPLLEAYLEQEGISRKTLAAGQRVRFYDLGYSGSTPAKIRQVFDRKFDAQLRHYHMASNPDYQVDNPFSLMWNIAVNPNAVAESGRHYVKEIQEMELHIPKLHRRTFGYQREEATGRILPVRNARAGDFLEGTVSPEEHVKYMADLLAWSETPEIQRLISERHEMWTVLKQLADERRDAELLTELQKIARNAAGDPFAEGIVYEMASYSEAPLRVAGTGATLTVALEEGGCPGVLMRHPPRRR